MSAGHEAVLVLEGTTHLLRNTGWTRSAWARNSAGVHIWWTNEDCVCYCLAGALMKAHDIIKEKLQDKQGALNLAIQAVNKACGGHYITWNDDIARTAEEVINVTLQAAEFLKGQPEYAV